MCQKPNKILATQNSQNKIKLSKTKTFGVVGAENRYQLKQVPVLEFYQSLISCILIDDPQAKSSHMLNRSMCVPDFNNE